MYFTIRLILDVRPHEAPSLEEVQEHPSDKPGLDDNGLE